MRQLELFSDKKGLEPVELKRILSDRSSLSVDLKITSNRVSMLSIKFLTAVNVVVRLHKEFLLAPDKVLNALCEYLKSRCKDPLQWQIILTFVNTIDSSHDGYKQRNLSSKGRVYDLKFIFNQVNQEFFNNSVKCEIGWGRVSIARKRSRRRSIRYGSWSPGSRIIRIHQFLDNHQVPYEFVKYIVFHEMLHVLVPHTIRNGRHNYHPPEFKAIEHSYPHLEQMKKLSTTLLSGDLLHRF